MSVVATAMQPLIEKYEAGRMDKNEILFSRYGAFNLFQKQNASASSILSPANRLNLERSYGLTAKIPVLEGIGVSIGNTRSCSVADAESTTAFVTTTFTPLVWGFTMYPGQYVNKGQALNYVGYDADFMHKADQCTLALMSAVDVLARNAIETNRNTYWPASIATSYYLTTGNALQISNAQKNDAFNQLSAVMEEMDFYGSSDVLGSTSLKPITERLENQGEANATNESFQFKLGEFIFTSSNRVTSGVGVAATGYLIGDGQIATVNRNNPAANGNFTAAGGIQWGTYMYPLLNMEVGTYYKDECAVSAGAVTDVATKKESYSFDTEIAFMTAYNSDPTTKPRRIVKFEISAS